MSDTKTDSEQLEELRGCLLAAGYEIGRALQEADTEIAAEKLAGNEVKEAMAKSLRAGLVHAAEICINRLRMPSYVVRAQEREIVSSVYLCLVTWPDGTEGLLFPRPGNVALADVAEQGKKDFETARTHLQSYVLKNPAARGTKVRLVRLEIKETLAEHTEE